MPDAAGIIRPSCPDQSARATPLRRVRRRARLAARALRRLALACAITVIAAPALMLVAEETAALLAGEWSPSAPGRANSQAPVVRATLYTLSQSRDAWGPVEPEALARALLASTADAHPPVLLVHGLDEPGSIWFELAPALQAAGRTPIRLVYDNDASITVAGAALRATLASLAAQGIAEVDLVAHSMGGLAAWDVLAPATLTARRADATPKLASPAPLPAVRRLILIASPVHGAPLAHLRPFAEAREQLVRVFSPSLAFEFAAFLRDGRGQASVDLAPDSALLRALRSRGAPRAQRVGAIAASIAPLGSPAQPDSLAAMLGDGAVPTLACVPPWADEVRLIRGAHRFILKSVGSQQRAPPPSPPPAVPIVLDMLAAD